MDECGRKQNRGENLDDQAEIFLLDDEYRGQRVRTVLCLAFVVPLHSNQMPFIISRALHLHECSEYYAWHIAYPDDKVQMVNLMMYFRSSKFTWVL
jgi:hypothetical protein